VFSGHGLGFWLVDVGPRQQVVELTIQVAIDDFGDDVDQIGKWLNVIELGRFDERGDGRPVLGPSVGACEQGVLPIEAIDRMERSMVLKRSRWPSSMKRINPSQREIV